MHLQKILYICSLMLLLALIWSCKDQIIVSPASLTVILTATPVSGQAPLQGVDLSAQVSGGTKESVTYRFDCTGDGIFDAESTTDDETFTATDVCSYDDPGIYTAMVVIERGDFSAIQQSI